MSKGPQNRGQVPPTHHSSDGAENDPPYHHSPGSAQIPAPYRGSSFQGMTIIGEHLVHMSGRSWPLAGAHAAVESARNASARIAPNRIVVGGGLLTPTTPGTLPPLTSITGQLVLVVEFADEAVIVTEVTSKKRSTADEFARRINIASSTPEAR